MKGRESQMTQSQTGDGSTNVQASRDVYIGVSYSEARQIALDVYNGNLVKFSEEAANRALAKVEILNEQFLNTLYKELPDYIHKLALPAVQVSLLNTQKEYAINDDKELENNLLNLLIDRIKSEERSQKQIALDQAILTIPKLSKDQINALTLIFSFVYWSISPKNIRDFKEAWKNKILPFIPVTDPGHSFFSHIQATGNLVTMEKGNSYNIQKILLSKYKAVFIKGFRIAEFESEFQNIQPTLIKSIHNESLVQYKAINDNTLESELKAAGLHQHLSRFKSFQDRFLMSLPEIDQFMTSLDIDWKRFYKYFSDSEFASLRPSSSGFAIAVLNYKNHTGEEIDLERLM